jgi:hypothetical protein
MTYARFAIPLAVLLTACLTLSARAQSLEAGTLQPAPPDPAALLAQADSLFDQAARALPDNPGAARALFAQSAAAYQTLIRDHNVRHAAVYTNLGNARLLSGDVGRAVADLRRAERLDPTSRAARTSLGAARAQVPAAIAPDTSSRALDILLVWRRFLPRSAVLLVGLCAWITFWTLGAVRLSHDAPWPRAAWIIVPGAIAALCLGGLLLEEFTVFRTTDAVVIGDNAIGRLGPDAIAFQPSFGAPLPPGVEGRIIGADDDWRLLRLADGRTTWLPAPALEEIAPSD